MTKLGRTNVIVSAFLIAGLALTFVTSIGDASADAVRVSRLLARAEAAMAAAQTPKERLAALGQAAQAQEAALTSLRGDLLRLAGRGASLDESMGLRERSLRAVLAALERLERSPRATALTHPGGAVAAARAGMTLSALAPALENEAARLRIALDELKALSSRRDVARAEVRGSLAILQSTRAEIAELLVKNRKTRSVPSATATKMAEEAKALARSAATLRALASALPRSLQNDDRADTPSVIAARGVLTQPIEGVLLQRWDKDEGGGVEIATSAYAELYAPWRGVVRFAGPFADHGNLIILEPEEGVLFVFGGLGETRYEIGDTVLAGEALGAMGGPQPLAEEFLILADQETGDLPPERFYMEVRRNGTPEDPATWFALMTEKGDG
ncbi:MAG: murein hydrolase activator EnvC family protein [Pikeienuella sp.]